MSGETQFSLSAQTNLFKINYYKKSENMYNSENVLQGRMKKQYNFTGKQKFVATPLSFSGGVGAGKLPKSNTGKYEGAIITSKRVYATCEVEREAIHASKDDKGAFVQATKETVKKTVESVTKETFFSKEEADVLISKVEELEMSISNKDIEIEALKSSLELAETPAKTVHNPEAKNINMSSVSNQSLLEFLNSNK